MDAVLTTTAASDIFTQDLEEISASIATLTPSAPAPSTAPSASTASSPSPLTAIEVPTRAEAVSFRQTTVHFGKNRGMTLADLTPQQLHWYEAEWLPKKEAQGVRDEGDRTLIQGLKAYREWREAEKKSDDPRPACREEAGAWPPPHGTRPPAADGEEPRKAS